MRRISMLLAAVALLVSGFGPITPVAAAANVSLISAAPAARQTVATTAPMTKAQLLAEAQTCAPDRIRRIVSVAGHLDPASLKAAAAKACKPVAKKHVTAKPNVAGGPRISGTIRSAGDLALPGLKVAAIEISGSMVEFDGTSDSSGTFSFGVDANASFVVMFFDSSWNYFYGFWDSASPSGIDADAANASPVDVALSNVGDVDVNVPALSGTVTNAAATGLKGIAVSACDAQMNCAVSDTDSQGNWLIGVAPGSTAYLEFDDAGGTYGAGFYSSTTGFVASFDDATILPIGSTDQPGLDVVLPLAVHISGTVTNTDGQGLEMVDAWACDDHNDCVRATTDAGGHYSIVVAMSATYRLSFIDNMGIYKGGWYGITGLTQDPNDISPVEVLTADVSGRDVILPVLDPWVVTLSTTAFTAAVGADVTITVHTTQNVGFTPFSLIVENADGSTSSTCYAGISCDLVDSSAVVALRTYVGMVGYDPNNYQAIADPLQVVWGNGSTYFGLTPNRVLDTRAHLGLTSKVGILAGTSFQVTGLAPTDAARNVPANATAVTGVLSVSNSSAGGWVSLTPEPNNNPTTSTINFPKGDARASGVTVPVGSGGKLAITYGGAAKGNTVDVAFDVTGYFLAGMTGAEYHSLTPNRLVDSRAGAARTGLTAKLAKGVAKSFQVTGRVPADATMNVPAGAVAVTGTLTVTNQTAAGFLTLGPDAINAPPTASLFFPKGDNRATGLTVKLGSGGTLGVTFSSATAGATTDVLFDVTGYFLPGPGGAVYVAVTPNRLLDDRPAIKIGLAVPFKVYVAGTFQMTGRFPTDATKNIPTGAVAVTGTVTVTNQTASGWLSLNPTPINKPTTSNLNFLKGDNRATGVTVPLGNTGALSVTFGGAGTGAWTNALFDVSGYFLS